MAQPKPVNLVKHDAELAWKKLVVITFRHDYGSGSGLGRPSKVRFVWRGGSVCFLRIFSSDPPQQDVRTWQRIPQILPKSLGKVSIFFVPTRSVTHITREASEKCLRSSLRGPTHVNCFLVLLIPRFLLGRKQPFSKNIAGSRKCKLPRCTMVRKILVR